MPSTRTTITTIPYRPSNLSQTLPPHSPIAILAIETRTPSTQPALKSPGPHATSPPPSPPPTTPLLWIWTCHICKHKYPLGATRRCLEDGHFFCAGFTEVERPSSRGGWGTAAAPTEPRVFRRHAACASEFDYAGWRCWGEWRRRRLRHVGGGGGERGAGAGGCGANCDFPSECRWAAARALPPAAVPSSGEAGVW